MSVLRVNGLKKSFVAPDGTSQPVVDVGHFELKPGEQIGLRGGSGTGKTTFLNLISGILREDEGEVQLLDQSLSGQSETVRDRLRGRYIGSIYQSFHLLQGLTALENVVMGMLFSSGVDEQRAAHLLRRTGLEDRMDYLPRQLSAGQQQRVALCRALAASPRLVLADEPTGNLDPMRAREAMGLISELCSEAEAALLVVSHDHELLATLQSTLDLRDLNAASSEGVA